MGEGRYKKKRMDKNMNGMIGIYREGWIRTLMGERYNERRMDKNMNERKI